MKKFKSASLIIILSLLLTLYGGARRIFSEIMKLLYSFFTEFTEFTDASMLSQTILA